MGNIISVDFNSQQIIDVGLVCKKRFVSSEALLPPQEEVDIEVLEDHRADPIKNTEDIYAISQYLVENERYRDNMLFITGINFGLRVSDLINLRFAHLINEDLSFKTTIPIFEIKTRNTRKRKQNRYVTINNAVINAIVLYLEHTKTPTSLSDYVFRSESNRGKNLNKPLTRKSVDRILKNIGEELQLNAHISTHSLRKTFGYHQMLSANNDPRKLLLLQKIFGHSTMSQTLDYIGITSEEIEAAYRDLNLGLKEQNKLIDSSIGEAADG